MIEDKKKENIRFFLKVTFAHLFTYVICGVINLYAQQSNCNIIKQYYNSLYKPNKIKILVMISLSTLLSVSSCEKDKNNDDKLSLERIDYNGNELRIDGYYYNKDPYRSQISVFFLYKNGIILYGGAFDIDETNEKEERYRNGFYATNAAKYKFNWGVFQIDGTQIKYEKWTPGAGPSWAFTYEGVILNDTTFVITKSYRAKDVGKKAPSEHNWVYHFKEFSPKPDSTNRFIP